MTSEDLTPDENLLERIALIEEKMRSICDLIPISTWGFSADVHEKLRQRKHRIVNQHLTTKEKRTLTNSKKQQVARSVGGMCRCVSEVFELLGANPENDSAPKKVDLPNVASKKLENKKEEKEQETSKSSVKADSRSDSDEGEHDQPETPLQKTFEKSDRNGSPSGASNDENPEVCSNGSTIVRGNEDVSRKEREKRVGDQFVGVEPKRKKFVTSEEVCEAKDDTLDILKQRELAMRKLQGKLKAMKAIREGKGDASKGPSAVSKLEEKRKLKRRISKMKMKQRRAKERQPDVDSRKDTEMVLRTKQSKDETVAFSKFDFIVKHDSKKKRLTTSEKKRKFSGKDYKSLIKKVEKREEKLEKLREREPDKAIEVEENIKWNRVLNKAQGVKVKDNMELLQKGLKRKEKLKEKKKENWSNREAALMREKEKKQEKRKENIQKRIDDKKRRKMKMLKKKRRLL